MISTNEFKTNVTVTIDGDAWQVVEAKAQLLYVLKCATCAPVPL